MSLATGILKPAYQSCTVFLYGRLEQFMSIQTTYTKARANFAKLCDEVIENREIVIINRRGANDVALVPADELKGLIETAHLLRSPKNADRLLKAFNRAETGKIKARTIESLREEIGIGEKE
jgi:antitoxin YefM